MNIQHEDLVIILLGAIVVFYAFRDSHVEWLPDLVALCFAVVAPRQQYTIAAVLLVAAVRHSRLAAAIAGDLPPTALYLLLPAALHMSSTTVPPAGDLPVENPTFSDEQPAPGNTEITRPVAEKSDENFYFGKIAALAPLVAAGEIGKTKAIQLGLGFKSGQRYQRASIDLQGEIDRISNHYPASSTHKRFE